MRFLRVNEVKGKRVGIQLSPHKLRHSFAISFLRNGANPFELHMALGHTTLEMTRRYTQALGFDDVFKRHIQALPVDCLVKYRTGTKPYLQCVDTQRV